MPMTSRLRRSTIARLRCSRLATSRTCWMYWAAPSSGYGCGIEAVVRATRGSAAIAWIAGASSRRGVRNSRRAVRSSTGLSSITSYKWYLTRFIPAAATVAEGLVTLVRHQHGVLELDEAALRMRHRRLDRDDHAGLQ